MIPVFVWRTLSSRGVPATRGRCLYCGSQLESLWDYTDVEAFDLDAMDEDIMKHLVHIYGPISTMRQTMFEVVADGETDLEIIPQRYGCGRCGWWKQGYKWGNINPIFTTLASLLALDINDAELALGEVRAHLARTFTDIYSLSPRRFEEVIAAIYRNLGWEVALTKQTRDGGVDLYCLSNSSGRVCIVECKRYAKEKTVGISTLDRLIGVQVRTGADEAHLVTSSHFTQPAIEARKQATAKGMELKLVDAHDLFRLLNVYSDNNVTLPDIRKLFADDPRTA